MRERDSAGRMISIEAKDLLAYTRESISRASTESAAPTAPYFVRGANEPLPDLSESERLAAACAELRKQLAMFGSLPPAPTTVRGRLGLSLVRLANRVFWWPIEVSRRFGAAAVEVASLQVEQHEQQRRLLMDVEKRLHMVETLLSRSGERP